MIVFLALLMRRLPAAIFAALRAVLTLQVLVILPVIVAGAMISTDYDWWLRRAWSRPTSESLSAPSGDKFAVASDQMRRPYGSRPTVTASGTSLTP